MKHHHSTARTHLTIVVLLLAVALPSALHSQQSSPTVVRDDSALVLIRHLLAYAGSPAAAQLSIVATGTIHDFRTDDTQPITVKTNGTEYVRNEIGSDFVFSRAGRKASLRYGGKAHHVPYQAVAYQRTEFIPTLLLLSELESPRLQCKMLGPESVNGSMAYHIRLSMAPVGDSDAKIEDLLSETHVWIDSTGMISKARVFLFSPEAIQNRSPVELYYSDYRKVGDFLFPFHILREVDHTKNSETTFTAIDVSAKLSPADFQ